jgi:ABC-type transport system involved in cytochrome c biogenesis permease subunit
MAVEYSTSATTPEQRHRKQTLLQIYLPVAAAFAIIGLFLFFLVKSGQSASTGLRIWADIAAIWIVMLLSLLVLITFLFGLLGIFGIRKIAQVAHENLEKANKLTARLTGWILTGFKHVQKAAIETEVYSSILSRKRKD